jgi:hypothetical protein
MRKLKVLKDIPEPYKLILTSVLVELVEKFPQMRVVPLKELAWDTAGGPYRSVLMPVLGFEMIFRKRTIELAVKIRNNNMSMFHGEKCSKWQGGGSGQVTDLTNPDSLVTRLRIKQFTWVLMESLAHSFDSLEKYPLRRYYGRRKSVQVSGTSK